VHPEQTLERYINILTYQYIDIKFKYISINDRTEQHLTFTTINILILRIKEAANTRQHRKKAVT